eukprot:g191.t1
MLLFCFIGYQCMYIRARVHGIHEARLREFNGGRIARYLTTAWRAYKHRKTCYSSAELIKGEARLVAIELYVLRWERRMRKNASKVGSISGMRFPEISLRTIREQNDRKEKLRKRALARGEVWIDPNPDLPTWGITCPAWGEVIPKADRRKLCISLLARYSKNHKLGYMQWQQDYVAHAAEVIQGHSQREREHLGESSQEKMMTKSERRGRLFSRIAVIKAEKPLTRKQAYDKALVHVSKFQLHNVLKKIPDGMMGASPPPGFKMPYPEDNPIYHALKKVKNDDMAFFLFNYFE